MGFINWITTATLCVLSFLVVLISASISYHEYIKSPGRRGLRSFAIYFIPISIAVLLLVSEISFVLNSLPPISFLVLILFVILLVVYTMRAGRETHCSKEEPVSAGGLDFVVCRDGPVNAWYSYREKKLYISDKLLKILSDEELKAIYYHEKGHRKHGYLERPSIYIYIRGVWLIFFSLALAVFVATTFKIINITLWNYFFLLVLLVSIAASISAIIIVWNWISEHESDVYSTGKVGAKPHITALVKLYVHGWLEKNGISTNNARVSLDLDIETITRGLREAKLPQIFTLLLKRSLHSALGVIKATSIYETPIPGTHPLLEYRVLVIWRAQLTQ
jgi:Zn-dependent protease with chaperone function